MTTMDAHPHGYFADPTTKEPCGFQEVSLRHLAGVSLPWPWNYLCFWVRVPQYKLLEDVLYVTKIEGGCRKCILVKAGFIFNGGSVPFLFWWLVPPDQPECLPAFVIHDWICTPPYPFDSSIAHGYLHDACRANGALDVKANNIWWWVRLLGPRFKQGSVRSWTLASPLVPTIRTASGQENES